MHLALKMKEEAAPTLGRVEFLPLLHAGRVHRHPLFHHNKSAIPIMFSLIHQQRRPQSNLLSPYYMSRKAKKKLSVGRNPPPNKTIRHGHSFPKPAYKRKQSLAEPPPLVSEFDARDGTLPSHMRSPYGMSCCSLVRFGSPFVAISA